MLTGTCFRDIGGRRPVGVAALLISLMLYLAPPLAVAAPEPLTTCTDEPTNMPLAFGDVVQCTIGVAGDLDLFRFQGTAGEDIVLCLWDASANNLSSDPRPVADLYEPGSLTPVEPTPLLVATGCQIIPLTVSGTYTIVVGEQGDNQTETYRVELERLFPTSPTAQSLVWGIITAGETIDPAPDQDFYTFEARQGSFVAFSLVDRSANNLSSDPRPVADLYAPDRSPSPVLTLGPATDTESITLTQEGVYTFHVYEYGYNQNETYNLGVECVFPPPGYDNCWVDIPTTCDGLPVTLYGTNGNDRLIGTEGDDVIAGLEGDDYIDGGGGADRICGGVGNDVLIGGARADHLFGETGNDVLVGDDGYDLLDGGTGQDVLLGMAGDDRLFGRGADDVLIGGEGADRRDGSRGLNDLCDQEGDVVAAIDCEIVRDP